MSDRFTRNILNVRDITKQPKSTNDPGDILITTDGKIYIRNEKDYVEVSNITIDTKPFIKSVNGNKPDNDGNVVISIDTSQFVKSVNGIKPDKDGNIVIPNS